tara:strand:- start:4407 stop:4655 length:249 start_codon:yes stop_codon:yes gene_type:complete
MKKILVLFFMLSLSTASFAVVENSCKKNNYNYDSVEQVYSISNQELSELEGDRWFRRSRALARWLFSRAINKKYCVTGKCPF